MSPRLSPQGVGAASVEYLVHSPMIRQSHFQRVILMSGSMFSSWARVDNPAENAVKLARELGCPLPADLYTHHTNILDCLRSETHKGRLESYNLKLQRSSSASPIVCVQYAVPINLLLAKC